MDLFEQAEPTIVRGGSFEGIALELVDNTGEKSHVRFHGPVPDIITLLQQRATRTPA